MPRTQRLFGSCDYSQPKSRNGFAVRDRSILEAHHRLISRGLDSFSDSATEFVGLAVLIIQELVRGGIIDEALSLGIPFQIGFGL